MRPSWSPASAGCSPSGVSAWILGVKWGVYCPLQPVEDDCSFCPHLMSWPCHKEAAIWRVKQLNFRLISAFHHCPSLVMLCFLEFRKQRCPPASYSEMSKYMLLVFQVLTCCINIANDTPNKKGKHYPYCKNVTSARGFLERRFPWLVTVATLTLPAPSPWQARFKGGVSSGSKQVANRELCISDHRTEASFAWAPRGLWSFATATHVPTAASTFAPSSAPRSTANGSEGGSTSGSPTPTWKVNLKPCFPAAASASSPFKELQSL